jgi:hypothetical protein
LNGMAGGKKSATAVCYVVFGALLLRGRQSVST